MSAYFDKLPVATQAKAMGAFNLAMGVGLIIRLATLSIIGPRIAPEFKAAFMPYGFTITLIIESLFGVLSLVVGLSLITKKAKTCIVPGIVLSVLFVIYSGIGAFLSFNPNYSFPLKAICFAGPLAIIWVYGQQAIYLFGPIRQYLQNA